jgi:hypothetical protein
VAHSILVIAFRLLTDHKAYIDLGPDTFNSRNRERTSHRLMHRLQQLGYKVSLEPMA